MASVYVTPNGKIYKQMPLGFVKANLLTERGKLIAQDLYWQSHPENALSEVGGEVIVTPTILKLETVIPSETDLNLVLRSKIYGEDERIAEATAFEKPLNLLSLGQWLGGTINYLQGETPSILLDVYNGNSGWTPDFFYKKYPRVSALLNMIGDITIPYGIKKGNTYLNTYKEIGSGGESIVFKKRNPFTTHVIKESVIPPEEMNLRNRVFVKSKYLGEGSTENTYRYKQPRMFFPKNPIKEMKTITKGLVRKHFFPTEYENAQGRVFFNVPENLVINDLGETGVGLIGRTWYGQAGIADGAVLYIPDFVNDMYKKGGKLNGR